jgi:hypothetical protein
MRFGLLDSGQEISVNSGPKLAENQRFEIAARPHLAVVARRGNRSQNATSFEPTLS